MLNPFIYCLRYILSAVNNLYEERLKAIYRKLIFHEIQDVHIHWLQAEAHSQNTENMQPA
jgi:hypothetical protein